MRAAVRANFSCIAARLSRPASACASPAWMAAARWRLAASSPSFSLVVSGVKAVSLASRLFGSTSRPFGPTLARRIKSLIDDDDLPASVVVDSTDAVEIYEQGKALFEEGLEERNGGKLKEAFPLLSKAAALDHTEAMAMVARCFEEGLGVATNPKTAVEWSRRAANRGDVQSMVRLSKLLSRGISAKREHEKAFKWSEVALSKSRDPEVLCLAAGFYSQGKGTEANPEEAFALFKEAAEKGHAYAMRMVSGAFMQGKGVEPSNALGLYWLREAARHGDSRSCYKLGMMYRRGKHAVERDDVESVKWLDEAAMGGDRRAAYELAFCLERGVGVDVDRERARAIYQLLADEGLGKAMVSLGKMYERGRGVKRNAFEAMHLYRKAALQGNKDPRAAAEGAYRYAFFFERGVDVKRSEESALYWYDMAKRMGSSRAQERMDAIEQEREEREKGEQHEESEAGAAADSDSNVGNKAEK